MLKCHIVVLKFRTRTEVLGEACLWKSSWISFWKIRSICSSQITTSPRREPSSHLSEHLQQLGSGHKAPAWWSWVVGGHQRFRYLAEWLHDVFKVSSRTKCLLLCASGTQLTVSLHTHTHFCKCDPDMSAKKSFILQTHVHVSDVKWFDQGPVNTGSGPGQNGVST